MKKPTTIIIILAVVAAGVAAWLLLRKKTKKTITEAPVVDIYQDQTGAYTQSLIDWLPADTEVSIDGHYTDTLGDEYWHISAPVKGYVMKNYVK